MQLNPNTLLQGGKYRILAVLGQGGFGVTYLAEQTMMEHKVCIKEFFLKEYCDRDTQTGQVTSLGTDTIRSQMEKYQAKFLKEARLIARFDHPNVIRIHDVFTENNTAYYVMDYIEGENLNDMVKRRGAIPESEALGYIRSVADGLAYVHSKGVNHLDVKPSNIMIRKEDGRPVLIDFGMSKQYDEGGEQTSSTPIGISEGYAPIEQYNLGGVSTFSPQTDIYSLGATLYRLVTGNVPPKASAIIDEGLPPMSDKISQTTRDAIEKAMQFSKKKRPESIAAFISLLGFNKAVPFSPVDIDSRKDNQDDSTAILVSPESGRKENNSAEETALPDEPVTETMQSGFDYVGSFSEGLAAVKLNGKWGYVDKTGSRIVPCKYEAAKDFLEGLATVKLNGKYGLLDKTGKLITSFWFDELQDFKEGLAAVKLNGKWGYIDKEGSLITSFWFDELHDYKEGLAAVKLNGKWGYIDKAGSLITSSWYDELQDFKEGLAAVKLNGKWGYINKTESEILPFEYESAIDARAAWNRRDRLGLWGGIAIVAISFIAIIMGLLL